MAYRGNVLIKAFESLPKMMGMYSKKTKKSKKSTKKSRMAGSYCTKCMTGTCKTHKSMAGSYGTKRMVGYKKK